MGFFDWFKKGVDIEGGQDSSQELQPNIDSDEMRRKQAFNRLVFGTDQVAPQAEEGKKTVQIYMIKTNDDLQEVVEKLKAGEPAIANLSKVSKNEVQRTQDFLSGVVFVLGAHISTFAPNIFLITPSGVEIMNKRD